MEEIQRYTFYINSAQATSYIGTTTTNFNINLDRVLNLLSKRGRFALLMHSISIPFSFYQLDSSFNILSIIAYDATGNSKTVTISLTVGNYTATSILTELSTQLTTSLQTSSGSYVGYTPVFAFSYNVNNGLTTLLMKFGYQLTLSFSTNTTIGQFFGFTTNQTISSVLTVTSTSIVVTNPIYLLYLRSLNLVQFNNKEFIVNKNNTISTIIYRIPITTQTSTYIHYLSTTTDPFFISNTNITNFQFQLTNCLNTTSLDLQGLNFQFKFSIVEYQVPFFEPLEQLSNLITPQGEPEPNPELEKLKIEYDKNLEKLKKYKSRLEQSLETIKKKNLLAEETLPSILEKT